MLFLEFLVHGLDEMPATCQGFLSLNQYTLGLGHL